MVTMREQGIWLTSPKRFERELAQANKAENAKEVVAVVESNHGDEDSSA